MKNALGKNKFESRKPWTTEKNLKLTEKKKFSKQKKEYRVYKIIMKCKEAKQFWMKVNEGIEKNIVNTNF